MKRRLLRILVVLAFIALTLFIFRARRDSQAPHFVAGAPASIPPFAGERPNYDDLFENDRIWIWTWTDVNIRPPLLYWYDLRQDKVVGQLFNADIPSLCSRDGSRLLVMGSDSPESFRPGWLAPLLRAFNIRLPPPRRTETFWIIDTSQNSVKRVGSLSQYSHSSSSWHPSPDFRRGYTVPTTSMGATLYLCDLEQASLKRIRIHGYPFGWWDDHDILIEAGTNQFDLLDIKTEATRTLFHAADFDKLLASVASRATAGITNTSPDIAAVANWNGKSFDFYFGIWNQISGLKGSNSFVLRASADSPQLALLYPEFQFRWGGQFDRTGKQYLYPGESGQPGRSGNGAVYLQDLTSGAVSTIVPPDNKNYYALPRFYGNEAIYFQNNHLHRVGLDGSNDAIVFSP
jgi:hypothetical protein